MAKRRSLAGALGFELDPKRRGECRAGSGHPRNGGFSNRVGSWRIRHAGQAADASRASWLPPVAKHFATPTERFSYIECSGSMDSRNQISAAQSRAARSLLNWSRVRLGAKANLSEMAIRDFENGVRTPRAHNVRAIRQAIEDAGIVFTDEGTPSIASSEG